MSVISAPIDELFSFIDQIQEWMNVNRLVEQGLNTAMEPILDLVDWVGDAAQTFGGLAKQAIMDKLRPILDTIQAFLSALNAVIDAIQAIIDALMAPINAIADGISAIGDALGY
jgi:phage-related protein